MQSKRKQLLKIKIYRTVAAFLAMNILFEAIAPSCVYALTGGPSQPEVESFTPVGTSEMVDPFTGNFSYNIPLMNVDGYPINIGYDAGITMDQEASWVGLGWNINPGVINRGMRGIPDDFNGDKIVKELKIKENITYGVNAGAGIELFGLGKAKLGIDYSIGVKHNNYNGYGVDQSLNLALGAGEAGKSPFTGGLGLNSSSDEGLTLQPSVSYSAKIKSKTDKDQSLSFSVGCAFNSRGGLKALSVNASQSMRGNDILKKGKNDGRQVSGNIASSSFDFGMPTYTPQASMSMQNISITGNFKIGFEVYGAFGNGTIGGYYSAQKLKDNIISNPAYGYMNSDEGTKNDTALLDFNREKDGPFTMNTPALPITNFTYDIYSVSGQGVGGSYRAFRSDLGHVYDPATKTTSDGYSIGAEIGPGSIFHGGIDLTLNSVTGRSGRWANGNLAATALTCKSNSNDDPLYEKYYFKEANEKSVNSDPSFYAKAGGESASSIYLDQSKGKYNIIADKYYASLNNQYGVGGEISSNNTRKSREKRSQILTTLTRAELANFGLEDLENSLNKIGTNPENAKSDHIAEITTLKDDGSRYVYGIAAYNKSQEEVTFAVGKDSRGNGGRNGVLSTGLVEYVPGDNEKTNVLGRDNYYSNTKTPAYAHSYLLTAVLSSDYVDSDGSRGPSKGDIGSYTKFNYAEKIADYNWRIPVGENKASFDEGLTSDKTDDKASYVYGTKDLYYLTSIETKNFIAVFSLSDREDGYGVVNKNGKLAAIKPMKKLDKITLYAKEDYLVNGTNATEIKTVNFEYDYSLCSGIPNNINGGGKLTLKKIFFTYQKSNKARFSPYQFTYSSFNPSYNIKTYDRWGNYKPVLENQLYSYEYPYSEQNKATADMYAQAWSLVEITIPSGGKIKVDYESDDYAYVQNKQAAQMFKVIGIQETQSVFSNPTISNIGDVKDINYPSYVSPSNPSAEEIQEAAVNNKNGTSLIIKLDKGIPASITSTAEKNKYFREKYLNEINYLYFRFLMRIKKEETVGGNTYAAKDEYVSGYLKKNDIDFDKCQIAEVSGETYGCIAIKNTPIDDKVISVGPFIINGRQICPISKAAIQFGRLNMSRDVWSAQPISEDDNFGKELAVAMMNSNFAKNIKDMLKGANRALYDTYDVGKQAIMGRSWIRLNNPDKKKLGGGYRVKKIQITDQWTNTGIDVSANNSFSYGQEYTYTMDDGTSSGVASYEPQLGGDENPWKTPVFFNETRLLAPDDEHFMEEPFGESFFPSPTIGYSRVTIKNLQRANVTHNATGKTVSEFYTAKDFPTITERTSLVAKREKNNPLGLSSFLKIDVKDYMTASQGYLIELNDMHGKPKRTSIYQENQTVPITSVEYKYKSSPYLDESFRLNNNATVVYSNGMVDYNATIGMNMDFVSDMRESTNYIRSTAIQLNTDGFVIPPLPIIVPILLPSTSVERTQFRSAVVTKVIQRFGILEETTVKDLGSEVSTKNIAYDAETGNVLLTQTVTNFDDSVYSLTYPAYWYYAGMAPAYKNVGFSKQGILFTKGKALVNNALLYFAEGDEIYMEKTVPGNVTISTKVWVTDVSVNTVSVVDYEGNNPSGSFVKILRSGRRNQQGVPMASITTLTNPLNNISANIYENVLDAQAIEYTNSWKTFCDCYKNNSVIRTTNPYVLGTKGMYKVKKAYTFLSGRTQSIYNNNTNIRKDGVYTSFNPYYKMSAGKWEVDSKNWTFTSEATEFSPFGMELENKDALNRYSSAIYSYNQTLPIANASNAKYRNIGFDNFEDYDLKTCADNHFKVTLPVNNSSSRSANSIQKSNKSEKQNVGTRSLYYANIDDTESHSGKYSLRVENGTPISMVKQISTCTYDPCAIQLTNDNCSSTTYYCYSVTGGTAPYQFEWSNTGAETKVSIGNTGDKLYIDKSTVANTLIITITDKNNCKKTIQLNLMSGAVSGSSVISTK